MRKSKFSEHQIIAILKAVEAGRTVKDGLKTAELWDNFASTVDADDLGIYLHHGDQGNINSTRSADVLGSEPHSSSQFHCLLK
jgi:hypothetical protein